MIWTAYYYLDVSVMAQAARVLGKTDDARHYAKLAEEIKEAFNRKWLDRKLNQYATGTQTCNLVPLAIGLVPEKNQHGVVKNVVQGHHREVPRPFPCRRHRRHLHGRYAAGTRTGRAPVQDCHRDDVSRLGIHGPTGRHHDLGSVGTDIGPIIPANVTRA